MKKSRLKNLLYIAPAVLIGSSGLFPTESIAQEKNPPAQMKIKQDEKETLRFNFNGQSWEKVIKWFADEAKLSIYAKHGYPDGTFTIRDGRKYSMVDALDELNHRLQLNGFLLIRRNSELIVINSEKGFELSLIDRVKPEDLKKRGKYDLMFCTFDITGLDAEAVEGQIKGLVDEERGKVIPVGVSNSITVMEFGHTLRNIKQHIDAAKLNRKRVRILHRLKFINNETVMRVARPSFGFEDGEDKLENGSLIVVPGDSEKAMWISGTKLMVDDFIELANSMDKQENATDPEEITQIKTKAFPIESDAELIQKIISDTFSGTADVSNMNYSEETEQLFVRGTPKAFKEIEELLNDIRKNGLLTVEVFTYGRDPEDLIDLIKEGLGLEDLSSSAGADKTNAPTFFEKSSRSFLVRGTPGDVRQIQELAGKIDPVPDDSETEKKGYEKIILNPKNRNAVLKNLQIIWKNSSDSKLSIRMPDDRFDPLTGQPANAGQFRNPAFDRENGPNAFQKALRSSGKTPAEVIRMIDKLKEDFQRLQEEQLQKDKEGSSNGKKFDREMTHLSNGARYYTSIPAFKTQEKLPSAPAKQEKQKNQSLEEIQSKLGPDDVIIQPTATGVLVLSNNPANIRKVRRIISDLTVGDSTGIDAFERPIFFFLQHRKASEMKTELEEVLGLSSGGGGGGSAIANMASRAAGPIGGMLAGAVGGGNSVSTSSEFTKGDVHIHVDGKMNCLIVYAGADDIEHLEELIAIKDRAAPPHDPSVEGAHRIIPVKNRDVEIIKTLLTEQFKEYLPTNNQNPAARAAGGRGGNPLQALQRLAGGNKKKEPAKPSMVISADPDGRAIVVTGPTNLVDKVEKLVRKLDSDDLVEIRATRFFPLPPGVTTDMIQSLTAGSAAGGSAGGRNPTNRNGSRAGSGARPTGMPNLGNLGALRGLNFGGNRGGGATRGGGNRGGGNRGGGRGGRGR